MCRALIIFISGMLALGSVAPVAHATDCETGPGLMNAACDDYCNVKDCDDSYPDATAAECAAAFDDHRQLWGTAPPCEPDLLCPCYASIHLFADLVDDAGDIMSCTVDGATTTILEEDEGVWVRAGGDSACGDWEAGDGVEQQLSITWEEAGHCLLLIEQAAASAGRSCS